jgi:hypothetical protein
LTPANCGAQQNPQENKKVLQHLPPAAYSELPETPAIACDVSSASISPGQSVGVTTRVLKGDASKLRYSFESNAGRLVVTGNTARLETAGVSIGEITVTCVVVDTYGRRVSYSKAIRLGKGKIEEEVKLPAAPAHPPMEVPQSAKSQPTTLPPPPPPPPAEKPVLGPKPAGPAHMGGAPDQGSKPSQDLGQTGTGAGSGKGTAGGHQDVYKGAPSGGDKNATVAENNGATAAGEKVGAGVKDKGTPAEDAAATGDKEYAEGLAIQKWEKELRTGKIEYNLPTKMSLPDATEVSVVVHGYEDVSGPVVAGTQPTALKVSQRMRVVLTAEENPDEFKIEPGETDDVQLVPIDGTATWRWKVTPKEPAVDQKLTIRALLVYPDDPTKPDVQITSYTAEISVQVGSAWEWAKYLFWNDPISLLKYLLPGGAGFAFIAGLVTWWWKRRHPEKKKTRSKG